MSRAQAESVIKNIIREIATECATKGQSVSETLVAFMVSFVIGNNYKICYLQFIIVMKSNHAVAQLKRNLILNHCIFSYARCKFFLCICIYLTSVKFTNINSTHKIHF